MPRPPSPTRERLIEAARELFHAQGFGATGLAQILKQAGVNSGSLYHFFESKEELLLAVLDRYREMLWPVLLQPLAEQYFDPIDRVFALLGGYRHMLVESDCAYGCPIGNLALELNEFHPRAQALVAENFEGWRQAVRQWLDEAADRLPSDLDRDALATFILTTMEGGVMQSRSYRRLEPFDASLAMLRDYIRRLEASARNRPGTDPPGEPAP